MDNDKRTEAEQALAFAREAVRAVLDTLADGKQSGIDGAKLHAAMVLNVGDAMQRHGVTVGGAS